MKFALFVGLLLVVFVQSRDKSTRESYLAYQTIFALTWFSGFCGPSKCKAEMIDNWDQYMFHNQAKAFRSMGCGPRTTEITTSTKTASGSKNISSKDNSSSKWKITCLHQLSKDPVLNFYGSIKHRFIVMSMPLFKNYWAAINHKTNCRCNTLKIWFENTWSWMSGKCLMNTGLKESWPDI